jgi:hypothetical protein
MRLSKRLRVILSVLTDRSGATSGWRRYLGQRWRYFRLAPIARAPSARTPAATADRLDKKTVVSDKPWKAYNGTATGARPGFVPALTRTLQDGSKQSVKFDGVQGETLIDRKRSVNSGPRAKAQTFRQSEVLSQHNVVAVWEVPDKRQLVVARRLLRKLKVGNIRARMVEP